MVSKALIKSINIASTCILSALDLIIWSIARWVPFSEPKLIIIHTLANEEAAELKQIMLRLVSSFYLLEHPSFLIFVVHLIFINFLFIKYSTIITLNILAQPHKFVIVYTLYRVSKTCHTQIVKRRSLLH